MGIELAVTTSNFNSKIMRPSCHQILSYSFLNIFLNKFYELVIHALVRGWNTVIERGSDCVKK